jgi:methylenetetrahydrofolate--tRNA-(uracil-5-)-methyltransferase
MIHRNTYVQRPRTLLPTFETRAREGLFFAGQMSGVEGYVESAASGLLAGLGPGREPAGRAGALPRGDSARSPGRYISRSDPTNYQPTNIAFGLLPELTERIRDKAKRRLGLSSRALARLADFQASLDEGPYVHAASAAETRP